MSIVAERITKNTLILYLKTAVTMVLSLLTTRLVLNELGINDFGVFTVVAGAITLLNFLNVCLAQSSQRFMSYSHGEGFKDKQKDIFNISCLFHVVVGVVLTLSLLFLGPPLFEYVFVIDADRTFVAKNLYYLLTCFAFFSVVSVPYQAVLTARENMLMIAALGILESFAKLLIALSLSNSSSDKLLIYGILMAFIPLVLFITQSVFCHFFYSECKFGWNKDNKELRKEMLIFAGWALLGGSANTLANNGQGIILNSFFGTAVNAAQGISKQFTGQLGVLALMSNKAIVPVLTKFEGAQDRVKVHQILCTGSKLSFFLKIILFVPVYMSMPFLLEIWLVNRPPYSVEFCRLLLIAELIRSFNLNLAQAIQAEGRIKYYHIATSLRSLGFIGLSVFLLCIFQDPIYLFMAIVLDCVFSLFIRLVFVVKNVGLNLFSYLNKVLIPCAFSAISAFFLVHTLFGWNFVGFLNFFGALLVSTFTTATILFTVGLSASEFNLITSMIKKMQKHLTKS